MTEGFWRSSLTSSKGTLSSVVLILDNQQDQEEVGMKGNLAVRVEQAEIEESRPSCFRCQEHVSSSFIPFLEIDPDQNSLWLSFPWQTQWASSDFIDCHKIYGHAPSMANSLPKHRILFLKPRHGIFSSEVFFVFLPTVFRILFFNSLDASPASMPYRSRDLGVN